MKSRHKPKAKHAPSRQPARNPGKPSTALPSPWLIVAICAFLALMVGIVFTQTRTFQFLNCDDDIYVFNNPAVTQGLTGPGIASAFSYTTIDNWVPLTTLSHMLDWQLFGANAGGHHLTNVLLHAITAILLFLVVYQMTAALWRSAFIAAVFAIHPLRAESVAWISERKDVLCGVFFLLTIWAYVGYTRNPKSWARYLAALVFFTLALMAKPVVVTLPIILLLLDYWPLNRFHQPARLIVEKIPFLLLSLASCIPTVLSERPGIQGMQKFPLPLRIENALVSYVAYLWQFLCPTRLAFPYPYPVHGLPIGEVAAAVIALAAISWAVFHWRRAHPYLLVGWGWYLVMLVPVIGLVQVGVQSRADRHTYLSEIGLCILVAWFIADLSARWRGRVALLGSVSAMVMIALAYSAVAQVSFWKDDETLLNHTLALSTDNWWAHVNLGYSQMNKNQLDDAISEFRQAIAQNPANALVHSDLGDALLREGQVDDAIGEYDEALKIDPEYVAAHSDLGYALEQKGQFDQAIAECREALKSDPRNAVAYNNLGDAYYGKGLSDDAISQFQEALKYNPGNALFLSNIGDALMQKGQTEQAMAQYQEALKTQPDNLDVQNHLARAILKLAISPGTDPAKLLALAQQANQLSGNHNPLLLRVQAAAQAGCGQYRDAVNTAQQALTLATGQESPEFIERLQNEIAAYQAGSQAHGTSPTNYVRRAGTNGP